MRSTQSSVRSTLILVGLAGGLTLTAAMVRAAPAGAPTAPADPPPKTIDISPVKDKLRVVSDGKKHVIIINPKSLDDQFFFYGDGKTFWSQRTFGGGSSGDDFDRYFWDPRGMPRHRGAEFQLKDDKYSVSCDERTVELKLLSTADAKAMLASATFNAPRWTRQAYSLSRDDAGRYFYVDRAREPEGNKNFRLYSGQKGAMKLQKMINVVSDSEGDIFATRSGNLRVVLDKSETLWVQGTKRNKLINLPVEDNVGMIYNELGIYSGMAFGTPCDDL